MQQLDAVTLRALARELKPLLDNAKVSKVQHPSAHEFLITFWGGADRPDHLNLLFIQLSPEAPFCALTHTRHKQDTALHSFLKPTALCMLLRKHLNGASLQAVRTLPGERVLDLVFENYNELGNRVRLVLSLELMGKHTNMLLYDEAQGVLLAVAHGVSEMMSQYRELAAGLPYAPPPKPPGKRLLADMSEAAFLAFWAQKPPEENAVRFLNTNLAGFGQRILEDALALSLQPQAIYRQLNALEAGQDLQPAISLDRARFTLLSAANPSNWRPVESVDALVGEYFTSHWQKTRVHRHRQQLQQILDRQAKKLNQREKEMVPGAIDEIETLQAAGDRLLAAVSSREVSEHPPAHQGQVALMRYDTGAPWTIDVDPSCGWVENAQSYYRRAKKAKARRDIYQQISASLNADREYLNTLKQMVLQAETVAELADIEADIAQPGFGKNDFFDKTPEMGQINGKAKAKDKSSAKNKGQVKNTGKNKAKPEKQKVGAVAGVVSLTSSDGLEILLGKSGLGNDAIVGKLSRTDDLWLHVHQMPGSHVLVRSGKGEVPDQTLLEAAMLAVYYSAARQSLNVPVIYTQSKFVRKIPQSYPGHVNYRQERTVFITPDESVLTQLLETVKTPEP
jgi:predicted ribosome quality control (RQC) complex YloA/Tae2 family protein